MGTTPRRCLTGGPGPGTSTSSAWPTSLTRVRPVTNAPGGQVRRSNADNEGVFTMTSVTTGNVPPTALVRAVITLTAPGH